MPIEESESRTRKIVQTAPGGNGAEGSSDIDEARKGERAGASESIEAQMHERSKCVLGLQNHAKRSRRESNPHLRFRKPLFCPLNYGNNDLERINGLNGDGQDTLAVRGDFSRGELCARLSAACLRVSLRGHFHVNPYGCRD
jgi:hypothetical protein